MFVICIESSHKRGLGHLFRSLNLAQELRKRGRNVVFLVNNHDQSRSLIKSKGFDHFVYSIETQEGTWETQFLNENPQIRIWINDRLDTTSAHADVVLENGCRLVTFDDRSEAASRADINIAALVFDDVERLHGKRVVSGPKYLILDPMIAQYRRERTSLNSIAVTLGGADTYGVTLKVVESLARIDRVATIVTGPAFGHLEELRLFLNKPEHENFIHKTNVPSLAEELNNHDLAITGGGLTPFEAAAAGLPTIVIANEPFEVPVGKALALFGCSVFAGHYTEVDNLAVADLPILKMSRQGSSIVDLNGVIRVVDLIQELK